MTTCSAVEAPQDTPGLLKDASRRLKDTRIGFMDLTDAHRWGLRTVMVLTDVSLSIREFYDNIAVVPLGASDHRIPGSQWL